MYYDDNFGHWDTDGYEDPNSVRSFYQYVQRNSVEKECADCGQTVRLMPHYAVCNDCADARERGY
jgi:hypothetical protein